MENIMKYKHSFIVSRFQPFHNGHKSLVDKMLNESEYGTIVLGLAQESRTAKNPFTADERIFMIKNVYGEPKNLNIFAINDIPDDSKWYDYVISNVIEKSKNFGKPEAFYCGGTEEGDWFNKGQLKIEILDRTTQNEQLKISGTEIRDMIKKGDSSWKKFIPEQNIDFVENFFKNNSCFL
jgi:nicotinamide-nucleotide adenylyltransferase